MLKFEFLPKFSLTIVTAFIAFTIIGTQLHEIGHILVAKYYGYETELYHDSMTYTYKGYYKDDLYLEIKKINEAYKDYDSQNVPKDITDKVVALRNKLEKKYPQISKTDILLIRLGGPAQTIATSILGLIILYVRRKRNLKFKLIDWLSIFLALFILREVFNFVSAIYSTVFYAKSNFNGDEFVISRLLGLNEWIIPSVMLIVGLLISLFVIFKIIHLKYRFSFIVSGFVGGLLGFAIWFGFLGEFVFSYL